MKTADIEEIMYSNFLFRRDNSSEYKKIHRFVSANKQKLGKCSFCKDSSKRRYEWALIKGKTYSYNLDDYIELCVPCHRAYDITDRWRKQQSEFMKTNSHLVIDNLPVQKTEHLNSHAKSVLQIDKYTDEVVNEFKHIGAAYTFLNKKYTGAISNCLKGLSNTAFGYKWKYNEKDSRRIPKLKGVLQYQLDA